MKKVINLSQLAEKLKSQDSLALFCHIRPDGDCLGSALALCLALKSLGKKATVFCDDLIPERFAFLPVTAQVKNQLDGQYSAFVAVDCGDLTRLGNFANQFIEHKNTFNIDHHISNVHYAKCNYINCLPSNAQNVYDIICQLKVKITSEIANLLAMGIMTDTGNFRHKNVTPETFYTAGKLVELGADINTIYYHMFTAQSKNRAKLFGTVMQKIRYFHDGRFAIATVSLFDLENCSAKPDETEGFIDFVMGITGVEVGACILQIQENKFKISFRSKSANVNAVASDFGGGGHVLASGCQIFGEYEEVVDKIVFSVGRQLPE